MKLSKRLKLVVSFVEQGAVIADVGTDHGYVPVWLAQKGVTSGAIAIDVNRGPLERARSYIAACGLSDRIQTRLGDGLSLLSPGEADTVVMAGMGGPLIIRILTDGLEVARTMKRLILSPQSETGAVREFADRYGFEMMDEAIVEDEGKYYTVLCIRPGSKEAYIDKGKQDAGEEKRLEWKYGKLLLERKDPVLKAFLMKERQKYLRAADRLNGRGEMISPKRQARKAEVEEELALIDRAAGKYAQGNSGEDV